MSNVIVRRKFNLDTVTWQEAIDNLDYTINNIDGKIRIINGLVNNGRRFC